MTSHQFNVITPLGVKDYEYYPVAYDALKRIYGDAVANVYVIAQTSDFKHDGATVIHQDEFPFVQRILNGGKICKNASWGLQQFLKIYGITTLPDSGIDNWLILEGEAVFRKPIKLLDDNKEIFHYTDVSYMWPAYLNQACDMFGATKPNFFGQYHCSLVDFMMTKSSIMKEMIAAAEAHHSMDFIDAVAKTTAANGGANFAEYVMYQTYVHHSGRPHDEIFIRMPELVVGQDLSWCDIIVYHHALSQGRMLPQDIIYK